MTCPRAEDVRRLLGEHPPTAEEAEALHLHADGCAECGALLGHAKTIAPRTPPGSGPGPAAPEKWAQRLGRYVLLEVLGRGGMGIVYAAFDPELNRKIAVKVLQGHLGEAQLRLLREAQAMAQLSHAHVITVHDVGVQDGQVFVAMELIDGGSLRQWLEQAPRGWRETVAVYRAAGQGLAAAHAAGLVHLDFKPDNVLVGTDGRVRVTDFGLARAIDLGRGANEPVETRATPTNVLGAPVTATGAVTGTPAYMAPERSSGALDPRVDVFSFGVALYEALYGELPFKVSWVSAERTPPPFPAGREVPSWVQKILARALAIDPAARYPDMGALLSELERDPATARRRRWAWAGAALLLTATGGLIYRVDANRQQLCAGGEARLAGVWDRQVRAQVASAFAASGKPYAADATAKVSAALDQYAAGWVEMHQDTCAATRIRGEQADSVLALRMACLDRALTEVRAFTRLLAKADGALVARSPDAVETLAPLEACADVEALLAPIPLPTDPRMRAEVERLRTALAEARAEKIAGHYDVSLKLHEQALASARTVAFGPLVAEALFQLGDVQVAKSEFEQGADTLEDAFRAALAARHDSIALLAANRLVGVATSAEQFAVGDRWSKIAEALADRTHASPQQRSQVLSARSGLLVQWGKVEEGRAPAQKALELLQSSGATEPLKFARAHSALAAVALYMDELADAKDHYQQALGYYEQALGKDHPGNNAPLQNLGVVNTSLGNYDEAAQYFDRALALAKSSKPKSTNVATVLFNLGVVRQKQGRFEDAAAINREAVALYDELQPDHPFSARPRAALGQALLSLGKAKEAVPPLERAVELASKADGDPEVRAEVRFELAQAVWAAGGDRKRALALVEQATADLTPLPQPSAKAQLAEIAKWAQTR